MTISRLMFLFAFPRSGYLVVRPIATSMPSSLWSSHTLRLAAERYLSVISWR